MQIEEAKEKLHPFIRHGFEIDGVAGKQAFGTVPFAKKFYVNVENFLWDSKVMNISGNINGYLERVHKVYVKNLTKEDLKKLAANRGLPEEAFKGAEIGILGKHYIFPVRNEKGHVQDLRIYELGKRLLATKGCQTGLWGCEKFANHKDRSTVYICEGEWDGIAFQWLLQKNKLPGIVVAVPGANTFKKEWVNLFDGKDCVVMYDNDKAGNEGEQAVISKLKNTAKSMRFIHWQDKFPEGFDVRDFICIEAVKNKRPKRCFEQLMKMVKNESRKGDKIENISSEWNEEKKPELQVDVKVNWNSLVRTIKKWLKIEDLNPIKIATAIVLSNQIEGDPVWMFLVACPGVGKSEILGMLKYCPDVYTTSSITPNALISGAIAYKGKEPSLLPKLNKKTLCIKDFSTVQTMRDNDRDSLLGILRDAYDGSAGKVFGTGESKNFNSKFSILAGVTPAIYELDYQFSSLGERFLKIFIGEYLEHKGQINTIEKAMSNVGKEVMMREEFTSAMYSFIENTKALIISPGYTHPNIRKSTESKISYLAAWVSRMKGTVNRDRFEKDVIINKAYTEVGTRTGKQLKRLLLCFPTVIQNAVDSDEDYIVIKRVALDSVSAKREDIFRAVFVSCEDELDSVDVRQMMHITKYSYSTAQRTVDDLVALGVAERVGLKKPFQYRITKKMHYFTRKAELYKESYTKDRPFRTDFLDKEGEPIKKTKPEEKK